MAAGRDHNVAAPANDGAHAATQLHEAVNQVSAHIEPYNQGRTDQTQSDNTELNGSAEGLYGTRLCRGGVDILACPVHKLRDRDRQLVAQCDIRRHEALAGLVGLEFLVPADEEPVRVGNYRIQALCRLSKSGRESSLQIVDTPLESPHRASRLTRLTLEQAGVVGMGATRDKLEYDTGLTLNLFE